MALGEALAAHLATGVTTLCQCWAVTRADGEGYGFTDHDLDLSFDGMTFRADTGMTARALAQSTGLSVDNTEALGVLSDAAIREEDIRAGRFDGAAVTCWLVNWAAPDQRVVQFRGTLGEIRRSGGMFQAELRGIAEALNQPQGRVYQAGCTAMLGDGACGFDLSTPGYFTEVAVEVVEDGQALEFAALNGFEDRWFERGRLSVLDGAAKGLSAAIKSDRLSATGRRVELWQALRAVLAPGDRVRLEAGCDKRAETCRLKFSNFLNFRGFPHIPGEDWLMSTPLRVGVKDGGSLFS
ncbi:MAG: DUF2163 domain-containing protein [Rhodobacteraceae bacterium]|nr:DUF2163 domain-containing protein [Paracoccaceae bacterium]